MLIAAGALALLVAAGCGGGSNATLEPRGHPTTHTVVDADNGATVHARVGDLILVTLHSTYWQFAEPNGSVLVPVNPAVAQPGDASCSPSIPGSGCGTVRAGYRVARSGTARIVAGRASCGEAMRCTGQQGRWSVTVVATH